MQRIESVLPQPLQAPADWDAAIAWRYRKRANGCGVLEPVRHVGHAAVRSAEHRRAKGQDCAQHRAVRQAARPTTCC
jgi:hypothetical protein